MKKSKLALAPKLNLGKTAITRLQAEEQANIAGGDNPSFGQTFNCTKTILPPCCPPSFSQPCVITIDYCQTGLCITQNCQ